VRERGALVSSILCGGERGEGTRRGGRFEYILATRTLVSREELVCTLSSLPTLLLQYLLVVATPVEIVLLRVTFDGNSIHGAMHISRTGLQCSTDGVAPNRIVGTKTGRIFVAGVSRTGGALLEVKYASELVFNTSWNPFLRRCHVVNHTVDVIRYVM
jgi:hypothetical protein